MTIQLSNNLLYLQSEQQVNKQNKDRRPLSIKEATHLDACLPRHNVSDKDIAKSYKANILQFQQTHILHVDNTIFVPQLAVVGLFNTDETKNVVHHIREIISKISLVFSLSIFWD